MGGPADFENDWYVGQVKTRRRLPQAEIEALCVEMERLGAQKGKSGIVMTKRPAGRGQPTPWVIHCTEGVWRTLNKTLPNEPEAV